MRVLITREIPDAGLKILSIYKDRVEVDYRQGPPLSESELKKAVKGVDAIIPVIPDQITKEVIDAAGENLKIISTYSVGYDNIDVAYATEKKIYVANTPGNLTESVAEHSLALLFDLARHVSESDKFCREGKYKYWDPMMFLGPKIMGKTLGIIGFGRIGQQLARICKFGFNMKILYNDMMAHPEAEMLLDAQRVELDYLLNDSDVISIHCNLTPENRHIINEQAIRKMKPYAYLINTARGPIIDEEALVVALKEGWIAGAGLDVFEDEPKIHPELIKLHNVVLTPHIGSATWEARIQMARMATESIVDVLINQKPPRYLVNKELASDHVSSLS